MLALPVQSGPSLADARRLYDAGKYLDAISSASGGSATDARLLYLTALSYEKLNDAQRARGAYEQLANRGNDDPWRFVGRSGASLRQSNLPDALAAANEAVTRGPNVPEAHYQLGLVQSLMGDFAGAAARFDRAAQLDPGFAYAHYYAGLSHYKAKRLDLMASRFEAFVKLAPTAPERSEVESIMRTVRGR
jgi:tetratricopeptide (TPR) repeat protein